MTHDMLHVTEWHNGDKCHSPFSDAEMTRRQAGLRDWMAKSDVDAVLFTSDQGINHYSGWLYRAFGRKYGMVLTQTAATTISPGADGGQGWRRSHGQNVTYTDWRRDNYYRAVRQLTAGVRRLAIEFDHVSLDFRRLLEAALPGVEMVDVSGPALRMRMVKSDEELALLRKAAAICGLGARAAVAVIGEGVAEYDVAGAANTAMVRAVADAFSHVEPMEGWALFQSGINTDGANNPVTNRRVSRGDILSLNCFPAMFGYGAALGRTMFYGQPDEASLAIWEKNVALHRRAIGLIRPAARCNEIAAELNELCRGWGLLKRRSLDYGQSAGATGQDAGRESGVALREDVVTELQPGMVISVGPMVMLPQGTPGAGGYHEQDMLVVTEAGAEVLTRFPVGPEHNIIG